jgi:hypothetical protein
MFTKLLIFILIAALMLSGIFLGLPMMMDRVMADSYNKEFPFDNAKAESQTTPMPNSTEMEDAVEEDDPALPWGASEEIINTLNPLLTLLTPVPETQNPEDAFLAVTQTPVQETQVEVKPTPQPLGTLPFECNQFTLDMIQPVNWRILLQEEKADILSQYKAARERAENELKADQYLVDRAHFSSYFSELLLVENLEPQSLVSQKLLQGLLENLRLDPIYVPDAATLDQVVKQQQTSLLLSSDGNAALFMITQDQLISLAFLQEASHKGYAGLSAQDAQPIMGDLFAQAQQAVNSQPKTAMDTSRQLISQMKTGDLPWDLTIIRMEPYASEQGWEYLTGGHHVLCIDTKTGRLFTVTTDLLQNKIIGIATENMAPFLVTYANWVSQSRGKGQANVVDEKSDAILNNATRLMEAFSQKQLSSPEMKMLAMVSLQYAKEWQRGYWETVYQPVDYEQRLLDPKGELFFRYSLEVDEDLSLRSYTGFPAGDWGSNSYPFGRDNEQELAKVKEVAKSFSSDAQAAIDYLGDNTSSIAQRALNHLSTFWQPVSLTEPPTNYFRVIRPHKGEAIYQVYLSMKVNDEQGRAYWVETGLEDGNVLIIYSITREYDLPPDAVDLQG